MSMTLRKAIEAQLAKKLRDDSSITLTGTSCDNMADRVEPLLGYRPSNPAVSRTLSAIGWIKKTEKGHVYFTRPNEEGDQ